MTRGYNNDRGVKARRQSGYVPGGAARAPAGLWLSG
jgi:hypothetical protein